jgi:pyrroline-5-carboxylate reductase
LLRRSAPRNDILKMTNQTIKFAIIGAGAMGSAIVKGLINNKIFKPSEILLCDLDEIKLNELKTQLGVEITSSYDKLKSSLEEDALVILAVKPQVFDKVLETLVDISNSIKLISIAAGKTISAIEKYFPENEIFRVMPNTPAQISKAASAISFNKLASKISIDKVIDIFSAIGICVVVEEKDLDTVTALSGSGPAYIFLMTEALTKAGEALGLKADVAEQLARQTAYGAASLMIESGESAQELRKKVTSPNGTTQAGVENFQANNFEDIVFQALEAAKKRALELS